MRFFNKSLGLIAWAGVAGLIVVGLSWAKIDEDSKADPARVEPVPGTELARITLTQQAAQRLVVQTSAIAASPGGKTVAPYAALLYDLSGGTWVYVERPALTFVREAVVVDAISGDQAILTEGPPNGTEVVTVGVPELYGIEKGVGE